MKNMKIEKAEKLGLCFGVRRAIKLLKEAADKYGEIETLGPVAHNRLLVETLINLGVKPVNHLEQVQGKILAITTHGASPAVLSEVRARHIHIIDTTCPIVRKAQNAARELADAGFDVFIFGDARHSEVKGILGWAADKGIAALNMRQINRAGR
ncbi:MAG TPA: 4-hydroxy-3-methylbut-2-enyl diphosphate reductase, partial [Dehalococcoidia bacterium]|nr:4-hydroxy-3-methylbut-2-enyl diphosphate reductase [Dehalococcoidia bacterium]